MAGTTNGAFAGYANQGTTDVFALAFDKRGLVQGAWQAGSSEYDRPAAIAAGVEGEVYVAGETSGSIVPGSAHQVARTCS
ncbi:Hypothetical protein CAP_6242 [Chondromyces apiculatus DSM 436]|uniref:Cell surface protein n=1 Tax=Chondromyces apiculatus DSM 436 TaxID=1192034 RepID=A0A017T2B3_9BACT|nr:Hypothetical protein CAP_6242 [Chondromyces apiculatus DSM 436]